MLWYVRNKYLSRRPNPSDDKRCKLTEKKYWVDSFGVENDKLDRNWEYCHPKFHNTHKRRWNESSVPHCTDNSTIFLLIWHSPILTQFLLSLLVFLNSLLPIAVYVQHCPSRMKIYSFWNLHERILHSNYNGGNNRTLTSNCFSLKTKMTWICWNAVFLPLL